MHVTTRDDSTLKEDIESTTEEQELWNLATDDEFMSLNEKGTWGIDNDPMSNPLPTHNGLKIKWHSNGVVDRFKTLVVSRGNHPVYGENHLENYAPVVSFSLVRVFLYVVLKRPLYGLGRRQDCTPKWSSGGGYLDFVTSRDI